MGSVKYIRPKDATNFGRIRLDTRLSELAAVLKNASVPEDLERSNLVVHIGTLLEQMRAVELTDGPPNREALKSIIRYAYELQISDSSFSLVKRLRNMNISFDRLQGRPARQLQALGNYWRICLYLARAARTYRRLFTGLNLDFLQHSTKKRTVHAEIQLLLHHGSSQRLLQPRIIPASKKPCLLCHSFMRAYGTYHVPQTHGEIFQQWYIPEIKKSPEQMKRRVNLALRETFNHVQDVLQTCELGRVAQGKFLPFATTTPSRI
jgi:hypothetical protein